MQQIAARIYNSVVDQSTTLLDAEGYIIATNQREPDEDGMKYIIWQKVNKPVNYILYRYDTRQGYMELLYSTHKKIPELWSDKWKAAYQEDVYGYEQPDEELIDEIINELVQEATTIPALLHHRATYKPEKIPKYSSAEQQARKLERKAKWRFYIRMGAIAIGLVLFVAKAIDYKLIKQPKERKQDQQLKKEQILKLLQQYRVNNEDSVLMKDTNGIYYRYKNRLDTMSDTL